MSKDLKSVLSNMIHLLSVTTVEHTWQDYLRTYGPTHLRHASRGLRLLTENIRKIDETANIRVHLPRQIGYIVGLYEIYARRVGLRGRIPAELGQLKNLRVLSMGNNHLCGELPASLGMVANVSIFIDKKYSGV